MNPDDRTAGREESRKAQEELREAKEQMKMPRGFIMLPLFDSPPIVVAVQTIATLSAGVFNGRHYTAVTLNIGAGQSHNSSCTLEELLQLIADAQQ